MGNLAQNPIQPDLEWFQWWGTTSSGSLFQCVPTLFVKNAFLLSSLNLPSLSLKLQPLVLSQEAQLKCLSPSFLWVSFTHWKIAIMSPQSLLNPDSLSLPPQERYHLWGPPLDLLEWVRAFPALGSHQRGAKQKKSSALSCWPHVFWCSPLLPHEPTFC